MSANEESRTRPDFSVMTLVLVNFQCWNIAGETFIQSNAVYEDRDFQPRHRNIGAVNCTRNVLHERSLDRMVWDLGNEIAGSWRELSSPKDL